MPPHDALPHQSVPRLPAILALLGLLSLGGCAGFSPDGGMDGVSGLMKPHLDQPVTRLTDANQSQIAAEVERLLAAPLSMDSAVTVALLNNRGLQADYADLGIAEADLVQAGRLANPRFTFARTAGGEHREYERAFLFDLLGLLTRPARTEIESRRFRQAQIRAAQAALSLAAETRQAYVATIAARQTVNYLEDVEQAAEAGAQLARRMAEAGNFSRLRQERETLYLADVKAQLNRARQGLVAEQERLTRLLGLDAPRRFTLPARLPSPPDTPLEEAPLVQQAMDQRLDLSLARQELEGQAKNLGLTRATGLINVLEVGYLSNSARGEPRMEGYEIELALPLFDAGQARNAKAEALYTQALHRAAEMGINARSQVREAYAAYRSAHDLMRHYWDEVVPLQERISEENLLRYNGMLISVWELLADARDQSASVHAAIQALKDFWLAESALRMAVAGAGHSGGATRPATSQPAPSTAAAAGH
jgi:outer membrane protein TolC